MAFENLNNATLDQKKTILASVKDKKEKLAKYVYFILGGVLLINLICLFTIQFASIQGVSISIPSLFDKMYDGIDEVGGIKFCYVVYWILIVAAVGVGVLTYLKRDIADLWITTQLGTGAALAVFTLITFIVHTIAESDAFRGYSACFIGWMIPLLINAVYCGLFVGAYILNRIIPQLEKSIQDAKAAAAPAEETAE